MSLVKLIFFTFIRLIESFKDDIIKNIDEIIMRLDNTLQLLNNEIIIKFIKIDPIKIKVINFKFLNLLLIQVAWGPNDIRNKNITTIGIITKL